MGNAHEASPSPATIRKVLLYTVVALLIIITIASGVIGVYALSTSPTIDLGNESSRIYEENAITGIEDIELPSTFFYRYPEFATSEEESAWWIVQEKVYRLLAARKTVSVELNEKNGLVKRASAPVAYEPLSAVVKKTYLIYLVSLIFIISALSVLSKHRTTAGRLLVFFLFSGSLYLASSAPLMSRTVSLAPSLFKLFIITNYISCSAMITLVHFSLIFPEPKEFIKKRPLAPYVVFYGYISTFTLLYITGVIGYGFSNPFLIVWTSIIVGAFMHSIIKEKDAFLRKQIFLSLFAPMMTTVVFIISHYYPELLGATSVKFTYFSLLCLVLPFILPSAMDNTRLYTERIAAERNSQKEKERIRQDIHDYVLNDLANITISADLSLTMIGKDSTGMKERLSAIRDISRDSSRQLRGFLQITNETCTTWHDLRDSFNRQGLAMLTHHNIDFQMDMDETNLPASPPSLTVKVCLYKLFREALTNIVKHSEADAAKAILSFRSDGIHLEIFDNGKGFDPPAAGEGHYGIESMKKRIEEMRGTIDVESGHFLGTQIRMQIPLR